MAKSKRGHYEKWMEQHIRARAYFFECLKAQDIDVDSMSRELGDQEKRIQAMPMLGRRQRDAKDHAFAELDLRQQELAREVGMATFRAFYFMKDNGQYLTRRQRKIIFGGGK
jgi:hypothetical protein